MTSRSRPPHGRALAFLLLAAVVAACTPLRVDGRDVDNTSWRAVSVGGEVPPAGAAPTLRFDLATVEGNAGCNGYVGQRQATVTDGRLDLGDILATLGGCVDANGRTTPGGELELAFLHALGSADHIAFRGGAAGALRPGRRARLRAAAVTRIEIPAVLH